MRAALVLLLFVVAMPAAATQVPLPHACLPADVPLCGTGPWNGGFEACGAVCVATGPPEGWAYGHRGETNGVSWGPGVAHDGLSSLRAECDHSGAVRLDSVPFPVEAGRWYAMGALALPDAIDQDWAVGTTVEWHDSAGKEVRGVSTIGGGVFAWDFEWIGWSHEVKAPPGAVTASVEVTCFAWGDTDVPEMVFHVDSVSFAPLGGPSEEARGAWVEHPELRVRASP